MFIYKNVVLDGNDGTGKTLRANMLRKVLGKDLNVSERGILSEATLNDDIFTVENIAGKPNAALQSLIDTVKKKKDTLFVIIDKDVLKCQQNILERGDSIDVQFHNFTDLCVYREKFIQLTRFLSDCKNVMLLMNRDAGGDCMLIWEKIWKPTSLQDCYSYDIDKKLTKALYELTEK